MVFTACRPNLNFLSQNHPTSSPKAKKVVLKFYQHGHQTVKTIQGRKLPLFSTLIGKSGFKERFLLENFRMALTSALSLKSCFNSFNRMIQHRSSERACPSPSQATSKLGKAHVVSRDVVSPTGELFGETNSFWFWTFWVWEQLPKRCSTKVSANPLDKPCITFWREYNGDI